MDCDARTLPLRADPNVTRITYHEPTEGCCLPMPCCACAKGRDYNRINEDSIETNRTCYQCFTCDTFDSVHKTYLDMNPFKPTCFGLCKPQFTSYKDSMYCLYCIPCACYWDCCYKPCYGELVTVAPYYCDCCPYTLCIRCCSFPYMIGTKDSQSFTEKLMAQVQAMNAPGAHTGGINLTEGGAPAVAEAEKMNRD